MSTIAEFRVPASDTALGDTCEAIPSLVCEIEPVIAADDFGIWLNEADHSAINSALKDDPTVKEYSIITSNEEGWLYNIEFSEEITELFSVVVEQKGTILTSTAQNGIWTTKFRFPSRDHASQAYDQLSEHDMQINVTRLQSFSKTTHDEIGLTPEQYEALTIAIEYGYFEIPREISLEELADELGISHQALSERLRRGYQTLVKYSIDIGEIDELTSTRALPTSLDLNY